MVLVPNKLYTGAIKESFFEPLLPTMNTTQAKCLCSFFWKYHNFGFCWGALKPLNARYSMQYSRCKYVIPISGKHFPPFRTLSSTYLSKRTIWLKSTDLFCHLLNCTIYAFGISVPTTVGCSQFSFRGLQM